MEKGLLGPSPQLNFCLLENNFTGSSDSCCAVVWLKASTPEKCGHKPHISLAPGRLLPFLLFPVNQQMCMMSSLYLAVSMVLSVALPQVESGDLASAVLLTKLWTFSASKGILNCNILVKTRQGWRDGSMGKVLAMQTWRLESGCPASMESQVKFSESTFPVLHSKMGGGDQRSAGSL